MKNNKVIIWGAIPNIEKEYLLLLEEAGFTCEVIVDTYCFGNKICNIPVISSLEYFNSIDKYKKFPVIVTAMTNDKYLYYTKVTQEIILEFNLKDIQILYPSVIAPYLKLDFDKKPFISGFPGSGNALLLKILSELYESKQIYNNTKVKYVNEIGKKSANHLTSILLDTLHINNIDNIHFANFDPFSEVCFYGNSDGVGFISGLETNNYLYEKHSTTTHSILNEKHVENFLNLNFAMYSTLRHPLDILISNIFKIQHTMANSLISNNETMKQFRNSVGYLRLNNNNYFRIYVKYLFKYLNNYLETRDKYFEVKYENWFKEPIIQIKRIASNLSIECSDNLAQSIWEKYGFKDISYNDKYHYFSPSCEKWKNYLNEDHLTIIKEEGLWELIYQLGYSIDIEEIPTPLNYEVHNHHITYVEIYQKYFNTLYNEENKEISHHFSKSDMTKDLFNNSLLNKSMQGFSLGENNVRHIK